MGDMFGIGAGTAAAADSGKLVAAAVMSKKQRKWTEKMRATAHQTEVKDLISAGLNPVLSATGGPGAPMPGSGGFDQIADAMPSGGDVAKMVESLVASAKQRGQMDYERETAKNVAAKSRADAVRAGIEADMAPFMLNAQRDNVDSETHRNYYSSRLMETQANQAVANTDLTGLRTQLERAGLPRAMAREKVMGDVYQFGGKIYDWVRSQVPGAFDTFKSNAKEWSDEQR